MAKSRAELAKAYMYKLKRRDTITSINDMFDAEVVKKEEVDPHLERIFQKTLDMLSPRAEDK